MVLGRYGDGVQESPEAWVLLFPRLNEMSSWPGPPAFCSLARHGPHQLLEPRVQWTLPEAALVAAVCEEGHLGRWDAVALLWWPCQLPVLAVVEHLALGPWVWPLPPPWGVRVCHGHIHIPAWSFTAAETGKVMSVRKEEKSD